MKLSVTQTHPWTVVDAESGEILAEHVAKEGFQLVDVNESAHTHSTKDKTRGTSRQRGVPSVLDERLDMKGFDGLGASKDSYANAEVSADQSSSSSSSSSS